MTVRELIDALFRLPPDAEVHARIPDGLCGVDFSIGMVVQDEESSAVFLEEEEA